MSRWLDPSEVAKGTRPMERCPECPYPSRNPNPEEVGAFCLAHWNNGNPKIVPAVLPPSTLVAAPRWSGKPPRLPMPDRRSENNPPETAAFWGCHTYSRRSESRMRKVRDWHEPVAGCLACDGYAKWVLP